MSTVSREGGPTGPRTSGLAALKADPTSEWSLLKSTYLPGELLDAKLAAARTTAGAGLVRGLDAAMVPAAGRGPVAAARNDGDAVESGLHALNTAERALVVGSNISRLALHGETVEDVLTGGTHNATVSGRLIAGVGSVGGVAQAARGVSQLADGNTLEGAKNTGAGGLATAAGVLEFVGPAAVAVKAVPVLAGASGVVEGVGDIAQAVRDEKVEPGVVGGIKVAGGTMLAAAPFLAGTGIGAPAAAVVGVVGGAMLGGAELYDACQHFGG